MTLLSDYLEKTAISKTEAARVLLSGALGVQLGGMWGQAYVSTRLKKDPEFKKLKKEVKKGVVPVSELLQKVKDVSVYNIATTKDIPKEVGWLKKRMLKTITKDINIKPEKAVALLDPIGKDKKYAIITGRKAHPEVVGHEIGHIKDIKGLKRALLLDALAGGITGITLKRERKAWELSPFKKKDSEIERGALRTYEKSLKGARVGAGIGSGVLGGLTFANIIREKRQLAKIPKFLRGIR